MRRLRYLVRTLLGRRYFEVEVTTVFGKTTVLRRWPEKWMPDLLAGAERSGSSVRILRSY